MYVSVCDDLSDYIDIRVPRIGAAASSVISNPKVTHR